MMKEKDKEILSKADILLRNSGDLIPESSSVAKQSIVLSIKEAVTYLKGIEPLKDHCHVAMKLAENIFRAAKFVIIANNECEVRRDLEDKYRLKKSEIDSLMLNDDGVASLFSILAKLHVAGIKYEEIKPLCVNLQSSYDYSDRILKTLNEFTDAQDLQSKLEVLRRLNNIANASEVDAATSFLVCNITFDLFCSVSLGISGNDDLKAEHLPAMLQLLCDIRQTMQLVYDKDCELFNFSPTYQKQITENLEKLKKMEGIFFIEQPSQILFEFSSALQEEIAKNLKDLEGQGIFPENFLPRDHLVDKLESDDAFGKTIPDGKFKPENFQGVAKKVSEKSTHH